MCVCVGVCACVCCRYFVIIELRGWVKFLVLFSDCSVVGKRFILVEFRGVIGRFAVAGRVLLLR